jgi:L-aminopeptidase/D-esterase-like protein
MGVARTGAVSGNSSGDIFVAFSTANPEAARSAGVRNLKMMPNDEMDPVFSATVEAVEEAIVNAMVAAETMTGFKGHRVVALPHDRLRDVMKTYNRLAR